MGMSADFEQAVMTFLLLLVFIQFFFSPIVIEFWFFVFDILLFYTLGIGV